MNNEKWFSKLISTCVTLWILGRGSFRCIFSQPEPRFAVKYRANSNCSRSALSHAHCFHEKRLENRVDDLKERFRHKMRISGKFLSRACIIVCLDFIRSKSRCSKFLMTQLTFDVPCSHFLSTKTQFTRTRSRSKLFKAIFELFDCEKHFTFVFLSLLSPNATSV